MGGTSRCQMARRALCGFGDGTALAEMIWTQGRGLLPSWLPTSMPLRQSLVVGAQRQASEAPDAQLHGPPGLREHLLSRDMAWSCWS